MNTLCGTVVDHLVKHFQNQFEMQPVEDGCVVVTPFTYPDLASIEFCIKSDGASFLLTDEGETLNMMFVNGLTIEANKELYRQAQRIANLHNVVLKDSEIFVTVSNGELGEASLNLLNAIQAIGFLLYKRSHRKYAKFDDDVEELLLENEVRYQPGYSVQGQANTHRIRFYVNSNRNILLEPVTATTVPSARRKAKEVAYKWLDLTQANLTIDYQFAVVIDDRENRWDRIWTDEEARSAITTHSKFSFRWNAEKAQLIEFLRV
jgi:hypothetical protein